MTEPAEQPVSEQQAPAEDGGGLVWQVGRNGRRYYRIPGIGGFQAVVWQQGEDETVHQALERRKRGGSQKPPKSKKARSKAGQPTDTGTIGGGGIAGAPPPSRDQVTRQIQQMLEDILCSPGFVFAGFGYEWEANHFDVQGQAFAANVARSSERNPWLRRLLERGLSGEQNVVAILTSMNLATGAVGYLLPPLIKWGIVPAGPTQRRMFGVPPKPGQRTPPPIVHQPPVTDAMQSVVAAWQAAEQAGQGGAVDLGHYDQPTNGNDAQPEHPGVPQPAQPGPDPQPGVG